MAEKEKPNPKRGGGGGGDIGSWKFYLFLILISYCILLFLWVSWNLKKQEYQGPLSAHVLHHNIASGYYIRIILHHTVVSAYYCISLLDQPWSTKIHGRICHICRPKLRGQFFKTTWQSEDRDLYYVLVGFVYWAIFLPKKQNQITFRTMLKKF